MTATDVVVTSNNVTVRVCTGCGVQGGIDVFGSQITRCKKCKAEFAKQKRLALTPAQKRAEHSSEAALARRKRYREKHKDKIRERTKLYREVNKERLNFSRRLKMYGLTPEQYHSLAESQDFTCAICKCDPDGGFYIDHCHASGKVRGLLCNACNCALGLLKERSDVAQSAARYLTKHSEANYAHV